MVINDLNDDEDNGESEIRPPEETEDIENIDLDTGYEDSDPL